MDTKINKIFTSSSSLILLICLLFVYVFIRAYLLSFTHDECLTFNTVKGIPGYELSANNHYLNTYLITFFYTIFGAKEIFLRLPNVLAFLMYAFFVYKMLVRFKRFIYVLLGATLLLLNPYVLDFFSLARGYGLSLAFGTGALYFLFSNQQFQSVKQFNVNFSISMFLSLLSVYANLILINLNLVILMIFVTEFFVLLRNHPKQVYLRDRMLFLAILFANIIFLIFPVSQLFYLKNSNGLYVGGSYGFIHNTLYSLIDRSRYLSNCNYGKWIANFIIALFGVSLVFQIIRSRYNQLSKITLVTLLMAGVLILQNFFFGSLYPEGRMAIIFFPMIGIFIIETFHEIYLYLSNRKVIGVLFSLFLLLFLCIPLLFHFIKSANYKYVSEWRMDENTRAVVNEIKIQESRNEGNQHKITLSNDWIFEPSLNYYREFYSLDYLNPATRNPLTRNADYIYCTFEEKDRLKLNEDFIILKQFDDNQTILLQRKNSAN